MQESTPTPLSGSLLMRRHRVPRRITYIVGVFLLAGVLLLPFHLGQPGEPGAQQRPLPPVLLPEPAHAWIGARHLIVVCGHAVFIGRDRSKPERLEDESQWFLETFQHGQLGTMLAHIERGVQLAAADNSSLLLFSGGETRVTAGPRSEAASYWEAADAHGWWGMPHVRERAGLEVQARDSFENVLFAMCRFHELSGAYPERLTVVSFGFKRWRFEELHRAALRFPRTRFSFSGVDPPGLDPSVTEGEKARSARPFELDPYGCTDPGLRRKRAERNPFRRSVSYPPESCPAMAGLMAHCSKEMYSGTLPWSHT